MVGPPAADTIKSTASWRSRFSEQQIAFVLRQAEEGTPIAEVCRKAGVSEASFYAWRKKYGV